MDSVLRAPSRQILRPASTLRQQVIEALRACIADLTFKPGDRLVERELCEMLGVSRTLVREGLSQLVAEGLIQNIPHKGPIVSVLDAKQARGLYEIRAQLEALAAKRFALRATPEQRAELRAIVNEMRDGSGGDPIQRFLSVKGRFYDVLLAGCDNPILTEVLRSLHTRVTLLRATTLSQPGRVEKSFEEIEAIVAAAENMDGDAAALAAEHHVRQAEKLAIQILDSPEGALITGRA